MFQMGFIKKAENFAYRSIKNLRPAQILDADSNSIFSFASKHKFKKPDGKINPDGLVLTHLTDYLPQNGYITTTRSAIGGIRSSVHFAVNHGVKAHISNWDKKKLAILMPFNAAVKDKTNKFIGGTATDLFTRGPVRIPKGSVIVRYNEAIPKGKYVIKDATSIKELRDLRGVKLIETSETNMKENVDSIIQRLGYTLQDTVHPLVWGTRFKSSFKKFKEFNSFLKLNNMIPMMHMNTPNARIEEIIRNIMMRSKLDMKWSSSFENGFEINIKDEILKGLDYIENYAAKSKYPLDYDIKTLRDIIKTSKDPSEATLLIRERFAIKDNEIENSIGDRIYSLNLNEKECRLNDFYPMIEYSRLAEKEDSIVNNYIENPNIENFERHLRLSDSFNNYFSELEKKFGIE